MAGVEPYADRALERQGIVAGVIHEDDGAACEPQGIADDRTAKDRMDRARGYWACLVVHEVVWAQQHVDRIPRRKGGIGEAR